MHVLGLVWDHRERRPRAAFRLAAMGLLSAGLFLLVIRLVADPISASHKRGIAFPHLPPAVFDRVVNMIAGPLLTAAVVGSVLLTALLVDRRPLSDLGLRSVRRSGEEFLAGGLLGAALMTIILLVELAAGWVRMGPVLLSRVADVSVPLSLSFTLVKTLCVGLTEESVFRGYLIPNLAEALGFTRWRAEVVLAVAGSIAALVFGAVHLGNPNSSVLSFVGLALNGLMLAGGFVVTGGLAFPVGLHMAWNLFQGAIYGFPVSGDPEAASVISLGQRGPMLMTGGAFGPEAGLLGCGAALLGIAVIAVYARRRQGGLRPLLAPRWLGPGLPGIPGSVPTMGSGRRA